MDIIRRNTDYAFRLMAAMAGRYGKGLVSARQLAEDTFVPYQLTCKLLQKLAGAGLVKSTMGWQGGFEAAKSPDKISFRDVVEAIQGRISMNRCIVGTLDCPMKGKCPVRKKLGVLQKEMDKYLSDAKLSELL